MMDAVATWFGETLGRYIPAELVTFLVSLMPILECRGGIIVGRLLGLPLGRTILFSTIGNVLPIPFILLFIKKLFAWLKPTKLFGKIVTKLEDRTLKKSDALKRGEFLGLMLFVGIPLPGTGAWTGAMLLGVAIATTIVSLIMYGIL